ncbi:THUMP domain-containing protein 2 [Hypomesus transpacificus]|uniref:THUMP domain-containing protein 2 n=1 Tax=Hypomesus transpacificus TaxID=137520 RepID=UPI001F07321D|nr:THUMP domain-containing protein 2 [Hypomesus transpacificus]
MKKTATPSPAVQFYCTAGKGMESFLVEEVKIKLAAENVDQIPGKVFFSCPAEVKLVRDLKSAERLFLLMKRDIPLPPYPHTAKTASQIQRRLVGDGKDWRSAVETWRHLQRELSSNCRTASTVEPRRKRKREEDENKGEEGEPDNVPKRTQRQTPDAETKLGMNDDWDCSGKDNVAGDCFEGETFGSDRENTSGKSCALTSDPATFDPVTFRVSCRCSGGLSRHFSSQDLCRVIGLGLTRQLGWRVDLKNPEVEMNVHLNDDHSVVGIPLLRLPLASRSYVRTTGLRSTIAWAIGFLANIQPGSTVVDPMCGVGTILVEAAHEHLDACFLGVDIEEKQLDKARENVEFAKLTHRIQLLRASSMELPLSGCSVDAVLCDLPFGKKFGTKAGMAASLPGILTEMERVLRVGGTMVLLLSPQLSVILKRTLTPPDLGPDPGPPLTQQEESLAWPSAGSAPPLPPRPLSSLQFQSSQRVSLGAIDGLIHKYVKIQTASTLGGSGC